MISQSHKTGRVGEILAAKFLEKKGFTLVCKNYRIPGAEIDLIMESPDLLLFVEVKTRKNDKFGNGEDALTNRQKRKIWLAINHYLRHNRTRKKWRCDLLTIDMEVTRALVKQFNNIYEE